MSVILQIVCIVLAALFFLAFGVAREPRGWRRLYQSTFCKGQDFSVNKNKSTDEKIQSYAMAVAMVILVTGVGLLVWGVMSQAKEKYNNLSAEERAKLEEIKRIGGHASKSKAPAS